MGNSELAAVVQELERTICHNNNMCRREMNARLTGQWNLTIDAVQKNPTTVYTLRLFAFAPTLRELSTSQRADMANRAAHIYITLYIIKNRGEMSFETRLGLSASKLISAQKEKKKFDYFIFSLKKFSRDGGTRYSFNLSMTDVSIVDIQKNTASDNVLINFGRADLDLNYDSNDETAELDRAIRG